MALKETLDVLGYFGLVAGALTAIGLARKGWKLFGPSKWKEEPFGTPEMKAQRAEMEKRMKHLGLPVREHSLK